MKNALVTLGLIAVIPMILIDSCTRDEEIKRLQPEHDPLIINLKWNKAYDSENQQQAETGLQWCFSFLGAMLPPSSYKEGLEWKSQNTVQINMKKLGFNSTAKNAFAILLPQLKASEEYIKTGAIDIGRFVMLTLNASNHYYKITGAERNYKTFESNFNYDSIKVAIIESSVSKGQRLIRLPKGNLATLWGFTAAEGTGSLKDSSFVEQEHEVLAVMPNGQLRFAVYNEQQELVRGANSMHTDAGKPAKCLWCHEIVIQRSFSAVTSLLGYYPIDTFAAIVKRKMALLDQYRSTLSSIVDFTKRQDHTQTELLYSSFMEPSAERLANEWGISTDAVKEKLSGLNTHLHQEFTFLGDLYHRKEVEAFAPFSTVPTPGSAREVTGNEPDMIR